jgi:hypothetical protein
MTEAEYKERVKELELKQKNERNELAIEFAYSNSTVAVGDVVTDHIGSVKVERIGVYISYGVPECTYTGVELKKDLTPTKKGGKRSVYQSNMNR